MTLKFSKDIGQFLIDGLAGKPQILSISGPTGSGKTLAAEALANRLCVDRGPTIITPRDLKSPFNGFLMDPVVIVQETNGDVPEEVTDLLNCDRLLVKRKGHLDHSIRNRISWIVEA